MSGRCEDGELRRVEGRGRDAGRRGKLDLRDCRVEVSPPQVPDVHVGQVIAPVLVIILKCDPKFEPSLQLKFNKCG